MAEMNSDQLSALQALGERYAGRRGAEFHELLGYGGSAAVYRMSSSAGEIALKVYVPSFLSGTGGAAERHRIELQRKLIGHDCASLISYRSIAFEESTCFIEMEFLPWRDMSRCLKEIPREAIPPLTQQLVEAVQFLDAAGLVHRDIKPANVLVSPEFDRLVVIDLGVVRETSSEEDRFDGTDHGVLKPFIATAQYSSPEYLFRTTAPSPELWHALTIYQIGGVLHDLIARRPLFDEEVQTGNRYAVAFAVQQRMPSLDLFSDVPTGLRTLTLRCLSKDPQKRSRLVSWEDFAIPGDDRLGVQRRLAALAGARTREFAAQQALLERQLQRREYAASFADATMLALKEAFPEGVLLEQVQLGDAQERSLFRFNFVGTLWVMDISLAIGWTEGLPELEAHPDLLLHAWLARSSAAPAFCAGKLVGIATPESQNTETLAQIVVDHATRFLSLALAILEQGEPDGERQLGE